MNIYRVELFDSKNNEFFFVEVSASSMYEAICSAEIELEDSYAVIANLI